MCLAAGMDGYITKPFQPSTPPLSWSLLGGGPERITTAASRSEEAPPLQPAGVDGIISHFRRKQISPKRPDCPRLVAASRTSIGDNLAKANEAQEVWDFQALDLPAHTLKGTLLQCGLDELAAKAEEIHPDTQTTAICR